MKNDLPPESDDTDERTIGVELEYANVRGIDLAEHFPEFWEVAGDSSIRNTDGSWSKIGRKDVQGAELKTIVAHPVSWYTKTLLRGVFKVVRDLGGKPNRSCGLHIHVGTFAPSRKLLLQVADYFHKHPVADLAGTSQRRRKRQCSSIDSTLIQDLKSMELDRLRVLSSAFENGEHNYHRQREVNVLSLLKFGTIEYRMFASTLEESQVLAAIHWCIALTDACMNDRELPPPMGPLPPSINEL